ncbi:MULTISPECIES: cytochrome c maturation protein CcmE [Alkalimonas]|uniref:Cytochrome c-type biogenesis protein CcmE n=1 Tax=Alkalimonas amylolytica TaxID=152573 RepID=A0A1H4BLV3_ALKAM|nr:MULTISPECIES: cytochrome c maturation protein CcmE [Alkalimonas]MCC5825506.1 cytochrome c maturation protein CcmE [Alkalimonas sp.]SEA48792.1 cytochrome c-type biogenesis protein CcmE [Alkalimonas amylolytica]
MNARRQKRLWSILAILALVAGSIGAMLYALQQNINLFYTPTQLVEGIGADKIRPEIGQRLRIGGVVVEGSVVRDPESLLVRFDLVDTGPTVTVEYNGILPDLFREGQGIVAQGHLVEDRLIRATEVLAKHDEEYMPPEVAKALKGIQHVPPSQQTATESAGGY